jgi:hypothetical protein
MRIPPAVSKLVWVRAGGLCAFPGCRQSLVQGTADAIPDALIGHVAHIVGHSEDNGPRSEYPVPGGDRNGPANLVLLCPTHHVLVDGQASTYTVERLIGIKEIHERWVRERLSIEEADAEPGPMLTDTVYSTLLRVDHMPQHVYTAPCAWEEKNVGSRLRVEAGSAIALPYIVRAGQLIAFTRLTGENNPFADVISEPGASKRHDAPAWWRDKDLSNWYVTLLNRALNKLTGRRGLNLDKDHHRYFFDPERNDEGHAISRTVTCQPLNQAGASKTVVRRPKRRSTGEFRRYWVHLAVGLRFHRVTDRDWVLSVRPERRYTVDGWQPLVPKATGRRATSQKSHMYNYALLGELQFWKEYLSNGEPRMILDFGGQSLVIDAELLSGAAEWPGIPGDVKPFENVVREDDLFTSAAYRRALKGSAESDAELEPWELEDLSALESPDDTIGDEP